MKRTYLAALIVVVGSLLVGCGQAGEAARPTDLPIIDSSNTVTADAIVEPAEWHEVAFAVGGTAIEVLVSEGDAVVKDQVLTRLDAAHALAAVAQAEAGLHAAQARLDSLKAGARTQEIEIAQAGVDVAQAQLDRILAGARDEDLAPARASLVTAQASLQKLLAGASEEALIAARADYSNTVAAVQQAQAAYDSIKNDPGIAARPESVQLQQATNALQAAQARLDEIKRGASAEDIAIARGQVQQAQAQLVALQAPARPTDIAAAEAELQRQKSQLSLIREGVAAETIAAAEADTAAAQAALDQARVSLADLELRAPADGTVTDVHVKVGGQVVPGQAVIVLANLEQFEVRTTDLTELDIAQVAVGNTVKVSVDALPDQELEGMVQEIALQARSYQGDVVYDVTVALSDPQVGQLLRWGMTAEVRFKVK